MAAPNKQPKVMSSRLAGMKFMQRASASNPTTPSTPSESPSKKQRLSNGSSIRSPATPLDSPATDASNKGETKWYLSFKAPEVQSTSSPLRIVSAGFSTLDAGANDDELPTADDEQQSRPMVAGRKSFGNFGKQKPGEEPSSDEDDEDEDEEEDGDDVEEDDPTGVQALINKGKKEASDRARAERRAAKAATKAEAQRLAEQRRKKEVNLNKVTSISSGGGGGGGGKSPLTNLSNMICHRCKEKGHMSRDCPQRGERRR